ncbi:hypothetical protein [Caloramator proteoclasticus]|uniref:Lipoprotein n=1 Tax=Caloramator proteoclasticus DSM 10124 TaxID=1121262 RepID=A0A1M4ZKE8_9CLOT|nr:hypothetical protein [Caloramator proteoclasticus]SHF18484.1 hypothetical protein SAMN02746091_01948 [Caloramator proteoclasticus DSM 10124]
MKRNIFVFIAFFLILANLTGCSNFSSSQKVRAPKNKTIPIKGAYKVEYADDYKDDGLVGRSFVFKEDEFWDGVDRFIGINYKIKIVDMSEYLLNGYKIKNIDKGKEVQVVSVISNGNFLYDFIKINEELIMLVYNKKVYRLKKTNDEYDMSSWRRNINIFSFKKNSSNKDAAIFIGLRSKNEGKYSYKTYYIGVSNGEIKEMYLADNIFLPRKNGFWKIDIEDSQIKVNNISKGQEKVVNRKEAAFSLKSTSKFNSYIDFVGNDYIAIEEGDGIIGRLKIVPVDNPMQQTGISITDLLGESFRKRFDEQRDSILKELKGEEVNKDLKYENIGVLRRNGFYSLKGRINYKSGDFFSYLDFDTGFFPPSNMVMYDTLCIPMKDIKDKIPQAIDAYTSPNKDIAVIVLPKSIEFYRIKNQKLSEKIGEIKIAKEDKIIMLEWAVGNYSEVWRDNFIKNNSVEVININKN